MAKYNIPNLYIANRDRESSGGGSDPQLESRVEALEMSVDGEGGLTDQVDALDEQINGDSTATPPVPGIVDEIESLEVSVYGDSTATPPIVGLEDRVTALEQAPKGATFTKLWENQDATLSFDANTQITLSSTDYDALICVGKYQNNIDRYTSTFVLKGESILLATSYESNTINRLLTRSSDTLYVAGAGYAGGTNNAILIPVSIYGIKF